MTGPEHYRKAERLQRHAAELVGSFEGAQAAPEAERDHRAAMLGLSAHLEPVDTRAWREAAATRVMP